MDCFFQEVNSMTLKQLINETFSLNEEEELERKLLALRSEKSIENFR